GGTLFAPFECRSTTSPHVPAGARRGRSSRSRSTSRGLAERHVERLVGRGEVCAGGIGVAGPLSIAIAHSSARRDSAWPTYAETYCKELPHAAWSRLHPPRTAAG